MYGVAPIPGEETGWFLSAIAGLREIGHTLTLGHAVIAISQLHKTSFACRLK